MHMSRGALLCIASIFAVAASNAAVAADMAEGVQLPAMKGYALAHQHSDPQGNRIAEYVPKGQTVENWTDMVTVNNAVGSGDVGPRKFLGVIEAGWQAACPGSESHWIREGEKAGRPFALLMLSCPRNPGTGKPEMTWIKGIQGIEGFHTVQKSFRFEPGKDAVVQWIGWLRDVGLCGNRESPACG
ncbi:MULTISPECIES: hypothetical protein [Xanthomonas]|uniref:hypothetical protein n=1 Tax=Xanthomonas TaxID=338 RepID=UPI001EE1417F|nr:MULTISPECIES: hypothetical protein [Xanthomonas]MEB2230520.1 hypothetical protein [Xanthomonas campestris pv. campestris]